MSGLIGGVGGVGGAKTPTQRPNSTIAPMITSWRPQTAVEGLVIALLYGRSRLSGNIVQAGSLQAIPHTTYTQQTTTETTSGGGGGKGGGGGGSRTTTTTSSETTYTYQMAVIWALCEGPIQKIGKMWADKSQCEYGANALVLSPGNRPQDPLEWFAASFGQALGYLGLALMANPGADMGDNASLPNWSFEVFGLCPFSAEIPEANPADIIKDFLSNPYYGAGFLPGKVAALQQFSDYCVANGFFLSPVIKERKEAREHIADLLTLLNSEVLWYDDKLDIIPQGDETVVADGVFIPEAEPVVDLLIPYGLEEDFLVTFTPDIAPVLDLDEDDFIFSDDELPVKTTRKSPQHAYNRVEVEYLDRDKSYNTAIEPASDQAAIESFGLRPADTILAHAVNNLETAKHIGTNALNYLLYARNEHEFRLGIIADVLRPLQWVTLTSPRSGLDHVAVRILSIEQDDSLESTIKAVEWPLGTSHAAKYPTQARGGYEINFNVGPGNINPPVIIEPPLGLTGGACEIWVAASGGPNWGGAEVWISGDNATYRRFGEIKNPSRTGKLRAALPAGADPDQVNTLAIDLTESRGAMLSGSQEDDSLATLCCVEKELVAYKTATLVDANKYDLTYLRRGCYTTPISAHPVNAKFARLDGAVFRYPFAPDQIGTKLWIKFLSFNLYRGGRQALLDVEPYQYTIGGDAVKLSPPDVTDLVDFYRDGRTVIKWTAVTDPLSGYRSIDYEVRKGDSFQTAEILGRVPTPEFTTIGDGTYWVVAHTECAYSQNPATIVIEGSALPANILVTHDEYADGWPGIMSGGATIDPYGNLVLGSAQLFDDIPDFDALKSVLFDGGIAAAGAYEIGPERIVDLGSPQICTLMASFLSKSKNPFDTFDAIPNFDACPSLEGVDAGFSSAKIQIALAQTLIEEKIFIPEVEPVIDLLTLYDLEDDFLLTINEVGDFAPWQDYYPGQYKARLIKWRITLASQDPSITPSIEGFAWTVDMSDRTDDFAVDVPAEGMSVTYSTPFHMVPRPQLTIRGAEAGDDVVLGQCTEEGFEVQILKAGVGVARTLHVLAKGY